VTPGFPLAGTGPMDGVGSLPFQQIGTRQGRTGGGRSLPACCILAVGEVPVGHRYYGLLRLPNAYPRFLRGARSSPGTCRLRLFVHTRDRPGGASSLSVLGALVSRGTPREGDLSNGPRFRDRRRMRLSRVPVSSLDRRDLVYDPGGLRHGLPIRRSVTAFQHVETVRVRLGEEQASSPRLILSGHNFQTTFEAQYRPRRLASPGFRPSSLPAHGFRYRAGG